MIDILDKQKCCGCSACIQRCPKQCIAMQEDSEGFCYPVVDRDACIDCGLCEKVCPMLHLYDARKPLEVYAAINRDEQIRRKSSSGGIFTLLAEQTIRKGGVVFGARFDEKWEIEHDWCENVEELSYFRGSKYVQSRIGTCYRQAEKFLKSGRSVLFSGTSCQIAGLHRFLGKSYDNLLSVDMVCHGVPSPLVWREYIAALKKSPRSVAGENAEISSSDEVPVITGIDFRDKSSGWKRYSFTVSGKGLSDSGTVVLKEIAYRNLYMDGFLKDIYLRPSCFACPAKAGRAGSDITLGDYWGVEQQHPNMDDDRGTSVVLVHTDKGTEAFEALDCQTEASTYAQALAGNPSLEISVAEPAQRRYFYRNLTPENCTEQIRKILKKIKPPLLTRIRFRLKSILKVISK